MKDKITALILSCDKYSDLWEGNVKLFNRNWPGREFSSFIVTDRPAEADLPGVGIMAAGEGMEWSDRLAAALGQVKTDYVFVTLDDYYLIKPVDVQKMAELLSLMEREGYDYLRLYPRPKRSTMDELQGRPGVYHVDTCGNYSVNLYPGIWRKAFLEKMIREPQTAWAFEVSLSGRATEYGAKCLCSYNDDYSILDVVRKGKILHGAHRYFTKHPGVYSGNRPVQSWVYESALWVKTMLGRHSTGAVHNFMKRVYMFFGGESYTGMQNKDKKDE